MRLCGTGQSQCPVALRTSRPSLLPAWRNMMGFPPSPGYATHYLLGRMCRRRPSDLYKRPPSRGTYDNKTGHGRLCCCPVPCAGEPKEIQIVFPLSFLFLCPRIKEKEGRWGEREGGERTTQRSESQKGWEGRQTGG